VHHPGPLAHHPTALIPAGPGVVSGWGGLGVPGDERRGVDMAALVRHAPLTRGLGRAYGDSALPAPGDRWVAGSALADRLLAFDTQSGLLRAEAGVSLRELRRLLLPRGWFVPVTPGTQFVTLGGAVASDVHGKNHHESGTIGRHVQAVQLALADGRVVRASRDHHPDLFAATLGGQGLTGHVLEVELAMARVPSPWIFQESERVPHIERFVEALTQAGPRWPFTVGWIDCLSRGAHLGRGTLMKGRWADPGEGPTHFPPVLRRVTFPAPLPGWALNDWTVWAFNQLYYWKQPQRWKTGIVHPETFFYPLDAIHQWNRMYGRRGFTQHQIVIPREAGTAAVVRYLELLSSLGGASFLCVIKDCGEEGEGLLSFPKPGMSVALDIPIRPDTQAMVDRLNRFALDVGGRIYLAKDTFSRADDFQEMERDRLPRFLEVRRHWDPEGHFRSAQSVRLMGW
jgi:decaprenylphospho-beta-D-ribofuranose 2-oxidase